MMHLRRLVALSLWLVVLSGLSVQTSLAQESKSGLALSAVQSREFPTTKEIALASVIEVLQNAGYIIEYADLNTGFLTGTSPTLSYSKSDRSEEFKKKYGRVYRFYTKTTAFIESRSYGVRIRLNFVETSERDNGWLDTVKVDVPIEDSSIYENVFEEIDKAIFVRSNTQ